MATKGKTEHFNKRAKVIAKYRAKRVELRAKLKDVSLSDEEREAARKAMNKLPRLSIEARHRNRCSLTGRPRAYMSKFALSRMQFRRMALQGLLPGVTKSSW